MTSWLCGINTQHQQSAYLWQLSDEHDANRGAKQGQRCSVHKSTVAGLQARSAIISSLPPTRRVEVIAEMPEEDRAAVLVTMAHSERKRILREIKLSDPALAGLTMELIR